MTLKTLSTLAFLFIFSFGFGQTLVKDINTTVVGSEPKNLTTTDDYLYFVSDQNEMGSILYRINDTTQGAELVKDFSENEKCNTITHLRFSQEKLYIFVDNTGNGKNTLDLWILNKNDEFELISIARRIHNRSAITFVNGEIFFFVANDDLDAYENLELWKSDGSSSGTQMVERFCAYIAPDQATAYNNELYFPLRECNYETELWKSDGTSEGTYLLKDINTRSSNPHSLRVLNDKLYFLAQDDENGNHIWVSDGTKEGTVSFGKEDDKLFPVYGYSPGLVRSGNFLFFMSHNDATGNELWKTDGTINNTQIVKDIIVGAASSSVSYLYDFEGILFFEQNSSNNDIAGLWRSDGTGAGTYRVRYLDQRGTGAVLNGWYYFLASSYHFGVELWKTDGSTDNTYVVKDIYQGMRGSGIQNFKIHNHLLYFTALDGINGRELWKTDGTTHNTTIAANLDATKTEHASPSPWFTFKDKLYFLANTKEYGNEIWSTDGSLNNTTLLKNIASGNLSMLRDELIFRKLAIMDDYFLFYAYANGSYSSHANAALWRSDGTTEGTYQLIDINPGNENDQIWNLVRHKNEAYFNANDGTGFFLWKTSGTVESTTRVAKSTIDGNVASFGEYVLFEGRDTEHGEELWITDGTLANTRLVKDIFKGKDDAKIQGITVVGDQAFFRSKSKEYGPEIWKTDGTTEGTVLVKDINSRGGSDPNQLTEFQDNLYFVAKDKIYGRELWKSDGTEEGTTIVKDISPGKPGASPNILLSTSKYLYFTAYQKHTGEELWRTDGTAEGTILMSDFFDADQDYTYHRFTMIELSAEKVLFSVVLTMDGNRNKSKTEYWISDGSKGGTYKIIEEPYNTRGSSGYTFGRLGNEIYFEGQFGEKGSELYKITADICNSINLNLLTPTQGGIYQATDQITLFNKTADRSSVVVKAGYEIVFEEGFETADDGWLTASIEECVDEEDVIVIEEREEEIEQPIQQPNLSCFPNPAHDLITIQYQLPNEQSVSVELYSVLGSRVRVLENATRMEGRHQIEVRTGILESGNYFVLLRTKDWMEVQQIVVVK